MKLLLHAEHVVQYHRHRLEHPDTYGDRAERWYVCPNCCWVSCTVVQAQLPAPPVCSRPSSDTLTYLVNSFHGNKCGPTIWIDAEAPRVCNTLSAALCLGGPNAVIRVLDNIEPIVLGVMDPEGRPYFFDFDGLRPGSCTRPGGGWFATSHPSGNIRRKR